MLFTEVGIDWLKHAFITRFNEIPLDVYKDFTYSLAYDVAQTRQKHVSFFLFFLINFNQLKNTAHFNLFLNFYANIIPLFCICYRTYFLTRSFFTKIRELLISNVNWNNNNCFIYHYYSTDRNACWSFRFCCSWEFLNIYTYENKLVFSQSITMPVTLYFFYDFPRFLAR